MEDWGHTGNPADFQYVPCTPLHVTAPPEGLQKQLEPSQQRYYPDTKDNHVGRISSFPRRAWERVQSHRAKGVPILTL
jgi:hypothetical protein